MNMRFAAITIATIAISLVSNAVTPETAFIRRNYRGMQFNVSTQLCKNSPPFLNRYEDYKMKSMCSVSYTGEVDKKNNTWPVITIKLYQYDNSVVREQTMFNLVQTYGIDFDNKIGKGNMKNQIFVANENISRAIWASGDTIVIILFKNVQVIEEIIQDYSIQYPPLTFNNNELKLDYILKKTQQFKIDIWEEDEKAREAADAKTVQGLVFDQCRVENDLRCTSENDGQNGCPISLLEDKAKRNSQWMAFTSQIQTQKINLKKIRWQTPIAGTCTFPTDNIKKIQNIKK